MRRWLAILLLTVLPFQFSWAAMGIHCGHASGEQAQPLGHYDHPHDEPAGQASADDGSATAGQQPAPSSDADCGHCHCHGNCASLPTELRGALARFMSAHPLAPFEGILRTLAQRRPERPQWPALA